VVQWTAGYRGDSDATRISVSELAPVRLAARHTAMMVVWLGLIFNLPVLWRRHDGTQHFADVGVTTWSLLSEIALMLGLSALLLGLCQLFGRRGARWLGMLLIVTSAASAYYMAEFNVVIGVGVVQALFSTDLDLTREVIGLRFGVWLLLLGGLPALWWWVHGAAPCWWRQPRARHALALWSVWCAVAVLVLLLAQASLNRLSRQLNGSDRGTTASASGVAAHAYVPSNWIVSLGMVANHTWQAHQSAQNLLDPAQQFNYFPATGLDDLVVVLVIGETTRHDRMGVLGHDRDTTPRMSSERNLVAFAGRSCDTSTRLSLACMFVRPEGLRAGEGPAPDTVLERDVFSVYRSLGFRIDLYGLQGEAGFYARTGADTYKLREMIAAQPENLGRPTHDELLLPELVNGLLEHDHRSAAKGRRSPQLVILHTKGSHHNYSQRYPRAFARWTPECLHNDVACRRDEFLNSFDNSVLYIDHVLQSVRDQLRGRRALVIYSSDHGESIDDHTHFHATPRHIAPREQFRVPLVFWASDPFLANPVLAAGFDQLKARRSTMAPEAAGHHNLFASMLGCIGVQSDNGGLTPALNLCQAP
jgi:KDO II ethanolaminephosphotransferase